MGLYKGELEKAQENFSVRDCYERIYKWYMSYRLDRVLKRDKIGRKIDVQDILAYRNLRHALAIFSPDIASQEDMDFIFRKVIAGLMEWSYHEEDEFGIKMAAYAQFAINKK